MMNQKTAPYCATFGFDSTRIREVLSILGLSTQHGLLAERMRTEVIAGKADELVDSCLAPLARSRGFTLIERNIGIEPFKRTWIERLQYYGQDFETAEYFGDRLASAAAYARAKIPLGIFQVQHCLIQQVLIDSLSVKFAEAASTARPLVDCVLKLSSLDLYLTAEGYHLPEVAELQKALDNLRKETYRLHQEASIDQLTGLMNYAGLMESLEHEVNAAHANLHKSQRGIPCNVWLFMIDHD
jgi:hypothetical protein